MGGERNTAKGLTRPRHGVGGRPKNNNNNNNNNDKKKKNNSNNSK